MVWSIAGTPYILILWEAERQEECWPSAGFLLFSVFCSIPVGHCHEYSGYVFSPQLNLSGNVLRGVSPRWFQIWIGWQWRIMVTLYKWLSFIPSQIISVLYQPPKESSMQWEGPLACAHSEYVQNLISQCVYHKGHLKTRLTGFHGDNGRQGRDLGHDDLWSQLLLPLADPLTYFCNLGTSVFDGLVTKL